MIADADKVKRFDRSIEGVKKGLGRLEGRARSFATAFAGSIATAFAGVGIASAIKDTIELGDRAAKTAQTIGITAETFQELGFAAERSGVSEAKLAKGLQRLSRNILEANQGSSSLQQKFRDLGVEWDDGAGKARDVEDVLADIATEFANNVPESERAGRAMQLFGKAGAGLVPLLNTGAAGIAGLRGEARDLGSVMSNEAAASAEAAADAMTNLKSSLTGLRNSLVSRVLPALTRGGEVLAEWVSQGGGAEVIVLTLKRALVGLGTVLSGLALAKVGQGLALLGQAALAAVPKILAMTLALGKMALSSLSLTKIISGAGGLIRGLFSLKTVVIGLQAALVVIPLALAAILLAGQDLAVWLEGGDSLLGDFIERWRDAPGPLGAAARLLERAAPAIAGLFKEIQAVAKDALPALLDGLGAVAVDVIKTARAIITEFGPPILDAVKQIIVSVREIAPRVLKAGRALLGSAVKIIGALLPPALSFVGQVAKAIETIAPIVAALIAVVADLIASVAPKASALLAFVAQKVTGLATFLLKVLSTVSAVIVPIAEKLLGWWDTFADAATSAISSIESAIDSVMRILQPLLDGLDVAIAATERLVGSAGGTTTTRSGPGSITEQIRGSIASDMASTRQGGGTTIEIGSVSTTVTPQEGATQGDAARMTGRAVRGSLQEELDRAMRDFG